VDLSLIPVTPSLSKSPFDCGNEELNLFFRQFAAGNHRKNIAKTFVALADSGRIAGYFSLCAAGVAFEEFATQHQKGLPRYPVPAVRIARLAVAVDLHGQHIGAWLLKQAFDKIFTIAASAGVYAVVVDAIDDKAKGFYKKYGFLEFPGSRPSLFLPLRTIEAGARNRGKAQGRQSFGIWPLLTSSARTSHRTPQAPPRGPAARSPGGHSQP
jgi:GNAT superfamily N-acetyltransferase